MEIPKMIKIKQFFNSEHIDDIERAVKIRLFLQEFKLKKVQA